MSGLGEGRGGRGGGRGARRTQAPLSVGLVVPEAVVGPVREHEAVRVRAARRTGGRGRAQRISPAREGAGGELWTHPKMFCSREEASYEVREESGRCARGQKQKERAHSSHLRAEEERRQLERAAPAGEDARTHLDDDSATTMMRLGRLILIDRDTARRCEDEEGVSARPLELERAMQLTSPC